MMGQQDRVDQFKSEIAQMGVADPSAGRDRPLLLLGALLLIVGPVLCVLGYLSSHGTTNPAALNDATVTAIVGLSLTVAGGALFVRYSFAQFLRFWLARLSYEQQAQTDRLIDAMHGTGSLAPVATDTDTDRVTA
jgi:hypothetical protein